MKWRGLSEAQPGLGHATLREALEERRSLMEKYVPAASRALNHQVVDDLRASGLAERILPAGGEAPRFELPDQSGRSVQSNVLLVGGPLVLVFFRGRWCPFCVGQLEAWNAVWPHLQREGVSLAAISPQTVHQCFLMHDQHGLKFPLLSDAGNAIARRFGLVYRVPDDQQQMYSRTFVNLPFINGDANWELPLPATYVVGSDGRVLYAAADPDYTLRPEPREVLEVALGR